jgi:hypothetical protein
MIIRIQYRAQMNAALNVKVLVLPFNSWDELATTEYDVIVFKNTVIGDSFEFAPLGSIKHCIYKNQIEPVPIPVDIPAGYSGGIGMYQ